MPTQQSNYFMCKTAGTSIRDTSIQKLQNWASKYNHLYTYTVSIDNDEINHYFECLVPKIQANFQKLIKNALNKEVEVSIVSPKEIHSCDGTVIYKKASLTKNLAMIDYDQPRTLSKKLLETYEVKDKSKTIYTRWNCENLYFEKQNNTLYFSFEHKITELKLFGVKPSDVTTINLHMYLSKYRGISVPLVWNDKENCWTFNIRTAIIEGLETDYCTPYFIFMEPSNKCESIGPNNEFRIECKGINNEEWTLIYFANRYSVYTSGAVESILCKVDRINESEPAEVAVYIDGRLYNHYATNKPYVMIEFRQPDTPVEFCPEIYTPLSVLDHGKYGHKVFSREMMCSSIHMHRTNIQIGVKNCTIRKMFEGAFIPFESDLTSSLVTIKY